MTGYIVCRLAGDSERTALKSVSCLSPSKDQLTQKSLLWPLRRRLPSLALASELLLSLFDLESPLPHCQSVPSSHIRTHALCGSMRLPCPPCGCPDGPASCPSCSREARTCLT